MMLTLQRDTSKSSFTWDQGKSSETNRKIFEEKRRDYNELNASQHLHQAGFSFTVLKYLGS